MKIRNIVPLSEDLILKVNLIHRLNFYRENILDFLKEGYLEHILVMVPFILYRPKSSLVKKLFPI